MAQHVHSFAWKKRRHPATVPATVLTERKERQQRT